MFKKKTTLNSSLRTWYSLVMTGKDTYQALRNSHSYIWHPWLDIGQPRCVLEVATEDGRRAGTAMGVEGGGLVARHPVLADGLGEISRPVEPVGGRRLSWLSNWTWQRISSLEF